MKYENTNPIAKLHPGEPYFFLRAQDVHAPAAVMAHADGLLLNGDVRGYEEVMVFRDRMLEWQRANPKLVKEPD